MHHTTQRAQLIFVYNAANGLANGLLDVGRRIVQPNDYPCALCLITYGPFGKKKDWKKFLNQLPYDVRFMHKNQLKAQFPNLKIHLPAMLLVDGSNPKIMLQAADFTAIKDLKMLQSAVLLALQ